MELLLIRHPVPDIAPGLCYGQTDVPVTDAALDEAVLRLSPLVPPDSVIYTSPLSRCHKLAQRLHRSPIVDARLMEMHFGDWEMQPWDGLPRDRLDAWSEDPTGFAPPGGEPANVLYARVGEFLTDLLTRRHEKVVIVAHGGSLRALSGWVNPQGEPWHMRHFDYSCATSIQLSRTKT